KLLGQVLIDHQRLEKVVLQLVGTGFAAEFLEQIGQVFMAHGECRAVFGDLRKILDQSLLDSEDLAKVRQRPIGADASSEVSKCAAEVVVTRGELRAVMGDRGEVGSQFLKDD